MGQRGLWSQDPEPSASCVEFCQHRVEELQHCTLLLTAQPTLKDRTHLHLRGAAVTHLPRAAQGLASLRMPHTCQQAGRVPQDL